MNKKLNNIEIRIESLSKEKVDLGCQETVAKIFIDGNSLFDIIKKHEIALFEKTDRDVKYAGHYDWLNPTELSDNLSGKYHKPILLEECELAGSWILSVDIKEGTDTIVWENFSQEFAPELDYSSFGPFTFDKKQYKIEAEKVHRLNPNYRKFVFPEEAKNQIPKLSDEQFKTMSNIRFLIAKKEIISIVKDLFQNTRAELTALLENIETEMPTKYELNNGKISRGENYKNLPFVILDYPSIFQSTDIFNYRTLFWWGNFFSSTLHLQGKYLGLYRGKILSNFELLLNKDIFISVATTPWEHDYKNNNYIPLTLRHKKFIKTHTFLKLNKKFSLDKIESVPEFAADFFSYLMKIIS